MKMRNHGFTLIELAIVLSVLGLVVALSMGNIQSVIRGQRLTGATNQMITHLRLAREKAVAEGNNYVVTFRQMQNNYVVWDDEGNDLIVGGQDIRRTFPMPRGTRLQNPQFFGANRVIFRPDGTCNASGSVEIRNDELTKTVNLLASTGKVTVN
jgi:prepilin-type N-terminal cleavage/methylation domain-containing protein